MSKIEIIQSVFAAYGRGDLHTVLGAMDDAITWVEPGDPRQIPFSGVFNGKNDVMKMFGIEHQLLDIIHFTPSDFLENENSVLVRGNDSAKVKSTNKIYTTDWVMAFTFQTGLICQVQVYMDTLAVASAFVADSAVAV
jgi:ketosteroid isomerase-like protein